MSHEHLTIKYFLKNICGGQVEVGQKDLISEQ